MYIYNITTEFAKHDEAIILFCCLIKLKNVFLKNIEAMEIHSYVTLKSKDTCYLYNTNYKVILYSFPNNHHYVICDTYVHDYMECCVSICYCHLMHLL